MIQKWDKQNKKKLITYRMPYSMPKFLTELECFNSNLEPKGIFKIENTFAKLQ